MSPPPREVIKKGSNRRVDIPQIRAKWSKSISTEESMRYDQEAIEVKSRGGFERLLAGMQKSNVLPSSRSIETAASELSKCVVRLTE